MKTEKTFPRSFTTSSAAYRAIRQYESKKNLLCLSSGLVMTKVGDKNFLVSLPVKITLDEFNEKRPNVSYSNKSFRYFADGVKGEGYYELKTGDRRRPNSEFISLETVYNDFINDVCE